MTRVPSGGRPGAGHEGSDDVVRRHYREQAEAHDLAPTSTMADQTTRQLEIDAVLSCIGHVLASSPEALEVLEVGCGNGHLLGVLRSTYPQLILTGLDFSEEMVKLAASRNLDRCTTMVGDVRRLPWTDERFDVVVAERCIINLLEEADQDTALMELHRVLRPAGHLVLIEAYTDGLENLNRARDELGLAPTEVPFHNRWFDKAHVMEVLEPRFELVVAGHGVAVPPTNFLSSHYFISRVLYPAVTRREVLYNTEFVQFFRLLPPYGAYSPIQLLFLRRRHEPSHR